MMTPEEQDQLAALTKLVAEMNVKLQYIQDSVSSFCSFRDNTLVEIANFKNYCESNKDLPRRVQALEMKVAAMGGGFVLLCLLMAWGWINFGSR